jgi:hypothetical protein
VQQNRVHESAQEVVTANQHTDDGHEHWDI